MEKTDSKCLKFKKKKKKKWHGIRGIIEFTVIFITYKELWGQNTTPDLKTWTAINQWFSQKSLKYKLFPPLKHWWSFSEVYGYILSCWTTTTAITLRVVLSAPSVRPWAVLLEPITSSCGAAASSGGEKAELHGPKWGMFGIYFCTKIFSPGTCRKRALKSRPVKAERI